MGEKDLLEIAKYALKTGDDSITEQYQEVQSVRLRASFLITINALSSALFVEITGSFVASFVTALAILGFVACNLFCIRVMIPSGDWRLTKSGGQIVRSFVDNNQHLKAYQVLGILAIKTDEDQTENEKIVRRAHENFRYASYSFAASTIFWIMNTGLLRYLMEGLTL
ncbi:hypothetical protein [Shimia marina]|uniref:hypothetical protein n=1 Tax=Shimia marina TaxID=321267 RepID=UPI00071DF892|nr:hypothetical protein [Shimia marina]